MIHIPSGKINGRDFSKSHPEPEVSSQNADPLSDSLSVPLPSCPVALNLFHNCTSYRILSRILFYTAYTIVADDLAVQSDFFVTGIILFLQFKKNLNYLK